jgi:hypothetical protein
VTFTKYCKNQLEQRWAAGSSGGWQRVTCHREWRKP